MEKNYDFHLRTLKMVWNVQKSGLEEMYGWMCVGVFLFASVKNS